MNEMNMLVSFSTATKTTDNNTMTTENEISNNDIIIYDDVNNLNKDLMYENINNDDRAIKIIDENDLENNEKNNSEVVAIDNTEIVNSDNIGNESKKVNIEKKSVKKDTKNSDDESLDNDDDNEDSTSSDLSEKDYAYFEELYKKYREHKKPSQAMQLLLKLHDLETKTEADFAQIKILIRAERARVKAENARNRVNAIFKAEATASRKAIENKKFILGAGIYKGIENNLMLNKYVSFKQVAQIMIDKEMFSDDDAAKIKELLARK